MASIPPIRLSGQSHVPEKIVQRFDRWTAGHDGLLVLSPEDRRRRNEEVMAEMEQRRAAKRAASDGQTTGTAGQD
jgi:hypothetical protein